MYGWKKAVMVITAAAMINQLIITAAHIPDLITVDMIIPQYTYLGL